MNNIKIAALCNSNNLNIIQHYFLNNETVFDLYTKYQDLIDGVDDHNIILIDELYNEVNVYQICELLRHTIKLPIIMLSSTDDIVNEKKAFDIGCVDYIPLISNLEILQRRLIVHSHKKYHRTIGEEVIELSDNILLDIKNGCIKLEEEIVKLTMKQYEIIRYLITNSNRIISRKEIVEVVWQKEVINERIVDTHIKNIRKLIPQIKIDTVSGGGYRYIEY